MNISEVMKVDVMSCRPDETLAEAAGRMWTCGVGCLPVVNEEGHVVGMITDRDICMAAFTQGRPLAAIPVEIPMARRVFACLPSDELAVAEELMRTHQVRRLPVIDPSGHLLGIVSLDDLARAVSKHRPEQTTDRAPEVVATLAAVGAPRGIVRTGEA